MSLNAYGPRGKTHTIAVTQVASAPERVGSDVNGQYTYQFINWGANWCWVTYSVQNNPVAVAATPGNPQIGFRVLANEIVIYNLGPDLYFSAICDTGLTTSLDITPGEGM